MNYPPFTDPNKLIVSGFCQMDPDALLALCAQWELALSVVQLQTTQRYFKAYKRRDPFAGELYLLDTILRHADAQSVSRPIQELLANESQARVFADACRMQKELGKDTPPCTAELMSVCAQYLARAGIYPHTDKLCAGKDASLAALANGYPPRLLLSLTHADAALMQNAPATLPKKAALLRLFPTGNEPFANEIARFLGAHQKKGLFPIAVTGEEGILPHLMMLPGFSLNTTALPAYDPTKGPASLAACREPSFLFAAPQKHLYSLFEGRIPLFHIGKIHGDNKIQLRRAGITQLVMDLALPQRITQPKPLKLTLCTQAPTHNESAFVQDATALLGGIEGDALSDADLLAFLKEATARGADLKRATVTAVLTLPREKELAVLGKVLPPLLAMHRATAELSLPMVHAKTQYADTAVPCLSFFLHAPVEAPIEAESVSNFAALRDVFWNK